MSLVYQYQACFSDNLLAQRAGALTIDGHVFDPSVIAVLENVAAPQYERQI
jgi:hypothetical protein